MKERGLRAWYDDFTLCLGDSLRESVDHGLSNSEFGVVVLSGSFFAKDWPRWELDGAAVRQLTGEKVILPVWHDVQKTESWHTAASSKSPYNIECERGRSRRRRNYPGGTEGKDIVKQVQRLQS